MLWVCGGEGAIIEGSVSWWEGGVESGTLGLCKESPIWDWVGGESEGKPKTGIIYPWVCGGRVHRMKEVF